MAGKSKIVVSDLHLGAGYAAEGNALEDFDQDREFAAFLDEIVVESERDGADVELVLNGDTFEMWQVPHVVQFEPAVHHSPDQVRSSSEADSVLKIDRILDGHPAFFQALGRFLQVGPPRRQATLIKGNHDLHLYWPAVQDRIRQAVGATGDRATLVAFVARTVCREGIYVEHGNQYAEIVDRIRDMERPLDPDSPGQLAMPVGASFVIDVFNEMEWERPWIDGVKPVTALVWYALAFDLGFALRAIGLLLRALPEILGEALFGADEARNQSLAVQLQDAGLMPDIATRYNADMAFRTQFHGQLAELLSPLPRLPGAVAANVVTSGDPVAIGDQIRERVHTSFYLVARQRAAESGARVVIFGHTHDGHVETLPGGAVYINSGTWTWWADLRGAGPETWRELFAHPERFSGHRRRHFVRVDYDEDDRPSGRLLLYEPPLPPTTVGMLARLGRDWARFVVWLRRLPERIESVVRRRID